jgi:outer membrane protein TolC
MRQRVSIARYDFERAKLSLTNAMGLPIDTPLQLTDEFHTITDILPSVDEATEAAISQRPEVQAQYQRIKATDLGLSAALGERIPSIVTQGDYGLIGNRVQNTLATYNMAVLLQRSQSSMGFSERAVSAKRGAKCIRIPFVWKA